jgi:hypothetical protein
MQLDTLRWNARPLAGRQRWPCAPRQALLLRHRRPPTTRWRHAAGAAALTDSRPWPQPHAPADRPGPRPKRPQSQGKLEADARAALIAKGQALKTELEQLESSLSAVEAALQVEGQRLPNLTHPDVPIGGEEHAAVLKTVGAQREFAFAPKDHVTLGEALGLLDFETAAEVSGSKFYYLKNAAALLELALVNYAMTKV